ncbi:DUF6415 family natural product biosynthesis protein [Streptomyces sp. TLI_146]|uniref:DUF6415 family natural product biosynthesis protein n=1 Tax=Streptomyces sp. TLI_146 TaxID=1938858 RepID=UPI000CB57009|nr:DUF6415 family natural product biosynthesis protein [Streptomyces sp. TLI_146]PKV86277.1 hypothetical protein BX283_3840 [Streptomyces sp. TLI_146]
MAVQRDAIASRSSADWLASAHPTPQAAHREWRTAGIALIPTGRVFDALRLPAAIVHRAVGSAVPELVRARLGDGAVIHDAYEPGRWYYALVRPGACAQHDAYRLDGGTWLGVPEAGRTTRPGAYWIRPPRHREDFCPEDDITELIRRGGEGQTHPRTLPELDTIERACRALFDDDGRDPGPQDAAAATTQAWDHLAALLPVTQEAATQLPLDHATQARLARALTEAYRQLETDSSSLNLARQYAHAKRLARCCLDQVRVLRELDAAADAPPHL